MSLLSEYVAFQNGKKRPDSAGKYPVYGGNGVLDYASDFNMDGGVIIGRVGAYCGSVYLETGKCWVSDNAIKATGKGNVNLHYLYYLLKLQNLNDLRIGTSQPLLTQGILNNLEAEIPPMDIQKKIGRFLSAFDDKIALNTRINDNLREQADAVFDEAFLSRESLPAGWRKSSLSRIANYLNGLAMQKYRPVNGESGLPVLKIKELRQGMTDDNSERCSANIKPEYIAHDGDIIFSWSGSLLVDFWCGGDCGLNQHLFKVTSAQFDKWFVYAWTKRYLYHFIAIAADKATTMGHIKREELDKAEVMIPSPDDYMKIGALMRPLYDSIIANRIESRRLSQIRDALLPRLMSGELDVSALAL